MLMNTWLRESGYILFKGGQQTGVVTGSLSQGLFANQCEWLDHYMWVMASSTCNIREAVQPAHWLCNSLACQPHTPPVEAGSGLHVTGGRPGMLDVVSIKLLPPCAGAAARASQSAAG